MKKIIQRTRRFEKSFAKLSSKVQRKFIEKLEIFLENEHHSSLKTHRLKGKKKEKYAFSITDDIRAIYNKNKQNDKIIIIFTFVDIGTHNQVY
jgi:mRNA-degrading endonuclease YafQ of YafQ-DinJ toxin-antitoxin module